MSPRPATFVLIHGAWHGGWCWQKLSSLLTLAGHRVLAPDLSGQGQDRTPLMDITLTAYVERVLDLLDRLREPVILIGHGLGGMTISQAAEERPEKIRWLAYLTALLPQNGETALQIQARSANQGKLSTCMEADDLSIRLHFDRACSLFYHDCTHEDTVLAQRLLKPQALIPVHTPVTLSERFTKVPRAYLTCAYDRVLPPELQAKFYTDTPCERVIWLPSGHSPFFSIPTHLAARLEGLAKTNPTGEFPPTR
jgi:pimeloyl-ACP methyl ester carboxylesterase